MSYRCYEYNRNTNNKHFFVYAEKKITIQVFADVYGYYKSFKVFLAIKL